MIPVIKQSDADFSAAVDALRNLLRQGELSAAGDKGGEDIPAIVADVIKDVRTRGDDAVIDLTTKIENVTLTPEQLRVSADEIAVARSNIDDEFLALIRRVTKNIREYQEHIRITAPPMLKRGGRELGVRYTPIDRVAVYVPGMKAVYPS
ncbi:MAG: histidinol dehydrogenase, partial [Phycisphaerae bacterium]|nr:histidinol dehydrogenase [Phycisphaerae bacterium]